MKWTPTHNTCLAASLVALAGCLALTGCSRKASEPDARKGGAILQMASVLGGVPMPSCTSTPTGVSKIIRVKIHEKLDKLINPHVDRRVKLDRSATDSDDNENIYNNSSDLDPCSYHKNSKKTCQQYDNEMVPYSIDLTTILPPSSPPQWVEIKFLLSSKPSDAVNNLKFDPVKDDNGNIIVNGATVHDGSATASDICYTDVGTDDGHGDTVMKVFVYSPARSTLENPLAFNLVLIPQSGAIGTPILIDPKVFNNG
jgi:hypothetical protein